MWSVFKPRRTSLALSPSVLEQCCSVPAPPHPMPKGLRMCRGSWDSTEPWDDEAEMPHHGSCKVKSVMTTWSEGPTARLLEPQSALELSVTVVSVVQGRGWGAFTSTGWQGPTTIRHHVFSRNHPLPQRFGYCCWNSLCFFPYGDFPPRGSVSFHEIIFLSGTF